MNMARHKADEDTLLLSLEVPYICDYEIFLTKDKFLDIPTRHQVDWRTAHEPSSTSLNSNEAAAFLQEWLFFAVLNAVCNLVEVPFNPREFVSSSPEAGQVITGSQFRKYVWFWAGGADLGTSSSVGRFQEQTKGAAFILGVLEKTTNGWAQRNDHIPSANLDLVLLSLVQLSAHLRFAFRYVFHGLKLDLRDRPFSKSYPKYGQKLLLEAGWCVGELPALLSRYQPFTLLYLSQLDRRRDEKDHSHCSIDECVVNQLDWKTYETSHSPCCQALDGCTMIYAPIKEISEILEAGNIPIVSTATNTKSTSPLLRVEEFVLGREQQCVNDTTISRYVAISHVWSDGMGNPGANALYACQVRRIQRVVNDLCPTESDSASKNVSFWVDTLCVPLDRKIRSLAIARMARTYLHADKVLVIDNGLTESSFHLDGAKKLLFKIIHSDWNSRLWTFHEAVLAKECFFQFSDAVFTIDLLNAADPEPTSLDEVSEILSGIEENNLLSTQCTLNLLRALAHVDPSTVDRSDRVKLTAALPLQDDPHQELDRLIALRSEAYHTILCKIIEKWVPVLAKAESISKDPESDQLRLNSIIQPLIRDPARAHAFGRAQSIRGFGFDFVMKRSEDLAQGTGRQLLGNQGSPSGLLASTVAGVRGRLTSWREDETICLGGIISLDVSPIAQFKADSDRGEEQVNRICEERLKIFLSAINTLPQSILFWSSKRLTTYPWRWAPASFLDKDGDLPLSDHWKAHCTNQGLLVQCDTIRISPNQKHLIPTDVKYLRLRQRLSTEHPGSLLRPLDQYNNESSAILFTIHMANEIDGSAASWYDLFSRHGNELYLLKRSYPLRKERDADAVLVRILYFRDNTRFAYYLAKVRCIHAVIPELGSHVDGQLEPTKIQWCVG